MLGPKYRLLTMASPKVGQRQLEQQVGGFAVEPAQSALADVLVEKTMEESVRGWPLPENAADRPQVRAAEGLQSALTQLLVQVSEASWLTSPLRLQC